MARLIVQRGGIWFRTAGFWLGAGSIMGAYVLDVGRWRIRWARRDFRPLFSERYGYQHWHRLGRLSARRFDR